MKITRKILYSDAKFLMALSFSLVAIFTMNPYFTWNETLYFRLAVFVSVFLFLLNLFITKKINIGRREVFLFVVFLSLVSYVQITEINAVFIDFQIIIIAVFLLIPRELSLYAFNLLVKLFSLTLLPGIVVFLIVALGGDLNWTRLETIHSLKADSGLYYRNYIYTVVLSNQIFPFLDGDIFRFSGLYNEPGVVGTVSALLLSATGFKLDKWYSKLIFFGGLISFSLAFYIAILVYLLFARFSVFIICFVLFSFLLYFSYDFLSQFYFFNAYLYNKIFHLYNFDASVNNRVSECFEVVYYSFLGTPEVFFGLGDGAHSLTGCDVSHYSSLIYNYGVFGFVLIGVFYFSLYIVKVNSLKLIYTTLPFLIVFMLMLYQRPAVFSFYNILIFSGAILHASSPKHNNRIK